MKIINDLKELRRLTIIARDQMNDGMVKIPPENILQILDQIDAWKKAAEFLEELSGYDEIESDDDCPLKVARQLELTIRI